jgi:hypothetical protein
LGCAGALFEATAALALAAEGIEVGGSSELGRGFTAADTVTLEASKIGRDLNCDGGRFPSATGAAFSGDSAEIGGGALFSVATDERGNPINDAEGNSLSFEAEGQVSLVGVSIGGELSCRGGRFRNENGSALSADGAGIKGGVFLDSATDASGTPIYDAEATPFPSRPRARSASWVPASGVSWPRRAIPKGEWRRRSRPRAREGHWGIPFG